jgi:hypothetical protein
MSKNCIVSVVRRCRGGRLGVAERRRAVETFCVMTDIWPRFRPSSVSLDLAYDFTTASCRLKTLLVVLRSMRCTTAVHDTARAAAVMNMVSHMTCQAIREKG